MSDLPQESLPQELRRVAKWLQGWDPDEGRLHTRAADRIDALEAEVERLRARYEEHQDYAIALARIIEQTESGVFSDLIPKNLYHLTVAKRTHARIPDPNDLRDVLDSLPLRLARKQAARLRAALEVKDA